MKVVDKRVVVLGGGPTGLATAYTLTQHGVAVEVLEKQPQAGGICATFQYKDFSLDLGPHRFTPHTQEVFRLVQELCGEELDIVRHRVEVYLFGKFLPYPLRPKDILTRVNPFTTLGLLLSYLGQAAKGPGKSQSEETYEQWVVRRFGHAMSQLTFLPLAEKTWGLPASQISSQLAHQRIALSSLGEVIRELIRGKRKDKFLSPFYPLGCFLYPRSGFGAISQRLAQRIEEGGGVMRRECPTVGVTLEGNQVRTVTYEHNGAKHQVDCDFLVSTIPIPQFVNMISPPPPTQVLQAAASLRFRSLILLYLVMNKDSVHGNTATFFPTREFIFGRTWEQKNFSRQMGPKGKSVFGVEITCWDSDPLWQATDKEIFEQVLPRLEACHLLRGGEVQEYFTVRLRHVYPVWDLQYAASLGVVLDYIKGIDNLILNGRPGLFFYNNFHHSLEMGILAARHILSGKPKNQGWEQYTKRFEDYRIIE